MASNHYKYLETNRRSKKRWQDANRDKINARRRELRKEKKLKAMQGKHCLNCEILMTEGCKGTRIYCQNCVKNYPIEVRRHRWKRYYHRKKAMV